MITLSLETFRERRGDLERWISQGLSDDEIIDRLSGNEPYEETLLRELKAEWAKGEKILKERLAR